MHQLEGPRKMKRSRYRKGNIIILICCAEKNFCLTLSLASAIKKTVAVLDAI
jgi:hypothetical protein